MPFARFTIADPDLSDEKQQRLVTAIGELLASDLGKEPEATVVYVNLVSAERWYVAAEHPGGATGAHLEVSITSGTNTAEEKGNFLRHAYELLAETLGALPAAVYVALYELDGESYGYNGISQLARKRATA
jgi:4-oxalocrotonate tautomerase